MTAKITAPLALEKFIGFSDVQKILDIGSGAGDHAKIMRSAGKTVITNSLEEPADLICDFMQLSEVFNHDIYDGLWAAHVLEHQPNPNLFLKKCFRLLRHDGVLAITVPPLKHNIVGGHCSLWNAGIVLYHLILAGFDCSEAMVKTYEYNISVIVRKRQANLPPLRMDSGDIETLANFFPFRARQGFDGNIKEINWHG